MIRSSFFPDSYYNSDYFSIAYYGKKEEEAATAGWLSLFWLRFGTTATSTSSPTETLIFDSLPQTISELIYSTDPQLLEYVFPQWMEHYYTEPISGSLLHNFLRTKNSDIKEVSYYVERLSKELVLNPPLGIPQRGWFTETTHRPEEIISVSLKTSLGNINLKTCHSEYEFLDSLVPCFMYIDGCLFFRNLSKVLVNEYYSDGTFAISTAELEKNEDLVVGINDSWMLLPISSATTSGSFYVFNIPTTGYISVMYSSSTIDTAIANGTISINNGPSLSIQPFDFWSRFDELGLIQDIKRLPEETNYRYFQRIKLAEPSALKPSKTGLQFSIGNRLDLVNGDTWNGESITFEHPATSVRLTDYDYYTTLEHYGIKSGNKYYGVGKNWLLQEVLYSTEVLATPETSGYVQLPYSIDSDIILKYRIQTYSIATSGSTIIGIQSNENTPNINTYYMWTRGIEVQTLADRQYLRTLYNLDCTPTASLLDIANIITEKVHSTIGHTSWNNIQWLYEQEAMPSQEYLSDGLE